MKKLLLIVGILILIQTDSQACHPRAGFKVFHTNAVEYVAYEEDAQQEIASEPIQELMKISTDAEIEAEYRRYEEHHLKPYLAFLAHQKALMQQKQEMIERQKLQQKKQYDLMMQQRLAQQQQMIAQQKQIQMQAIFMHQQRLAQAKQLHETCVQPHAVPSLIPAQKAPCTGAAQTSTLQHASIAGTPLCCPLGKPLLTRQLTNGNMPAFVQPSASGLSLQIPSNSENTIQLLASTREELPSITPAHPQSSVAAAQAAAKADRLSRLMSALG